MGIKEKLETYRLLLEKAREIDEQERSLENDIKRILNEKFNSFLPEFNRNLEISTGCIIKRASVWIDYFSLRYFMKVRIMVDALEDFKGHQIPWYTEEASNAIRFMERNICEEFKKYLELQDMPIWFEFDFSRGPMHWGAPPI